MLKLHRVEVSEYGKRTHYFLGHKALFWYALVLWLVAGSIGWKVAGMWPGHREDVGAVDMAVAYAVAVPLFVALPLVIDSVVKWWRGRA